MTANHRWTPTHDDPLFILAMDHRDSFGSSLFGVQDDRPTDEQLTRMRAAKELIFAGLADSAPQLTRGRAGVLVDEQYGSDVIAAALTAAASGERDRPIVLAVPIEASGHDWFTLQWGSDWVEHVERIRPDYVKVLVRDNPDFDPADRERQFAALSDVSAAVRQHDWQLIYELLVPATEQQLAQVDGDHERYDRDLRPDLVTTVIADNQRQDIEPTLWKVEGLETVAAAEQVAAQVRTDGRNADLIVLGRDAPTERLDHWLQVAHQVEAFVGFAIGRSIWQDVIAGYEAGARSEEDRTAAERKIARRYLGFVANWR